MAGKAIQGFLKEYPAEEEEAVDDEDEDSEDLYNEPDPELPDFKSMTKEEREDFCQDCFFLNQLLKLRYESPVHSGRLAQGKGVEQSHWPHHMKEVMRQAENLKDPYLGNC